PTVTPSAAATSATFMSSSPCTLSTLESVPICYLAQHYCTRYSLTHNRQSCRGQSGRSHMNTQRYEAVAYAPRAELGDASAQPLERVSTRPAADFHEYVLAYARAQRWNVSLVFAGMALAVGAGV